jgi:hypothetical protein
MKEMLFRQNSSVTFVTHVSPALLLDDCAGKNCQRALADKSGLIRNCVEAVSLPPTTQQHLKVNNSGSFVSCSESFTGD